MSSDYVFAILVPSNVPAKLAFDNSAEKNLAQHITNVHADYMCIGIQRSFDRQVSSFLRRSRYNDDPEDALSDVSTEFDTEAEQDDTRLGMIWNGHYKFDISNPPQNPEIGWAAGKDNDVEISIANNKFQGIRNRHAIFNFNATIGYLYILSRGSDDGTSKVTVNGVTVPRGHTCALNQSEMKICLGPLDYEFSYTEFARSPAYKERQHEYAQQFLGIKAPNFDLTPTPAGKPWVLGDWTITQSLGKGSFGKVYSATDSKSQLVAIKFIEGDRRTDKVQKEVQTHQQLTELAEKTNDEGRLLHLIEVIYQNRTTDVALILQPVAYTTFAKLTELGARTYSHKLASNTLESIPMQLYNDFLKGVGFLHSHHWIHRDLKPENIGIIGTRAVILDYGGALKLRPGEMVTATPGDGGTINYLAPEREMQGYSFPVDVWAAGVIGFEIIFGSHPWAMTLNPWRPGTKHECQRPLFHSHYNSAMQLVRSYKSSLPVCDLFEKMLGHQWAKGYEHRISIFDALDHPCWLRDTTQPSSKRLIHLADTTNVQPC